MLVSCRILQRPVLEAGFVVSGETSGLSVDFQGYNSGSPLTMVHCHGNLCCTPNLLQRQQDQLVKSAAIWPINSLENGIIIHKRFCVWCMDYDMKNHSDITKSMQRFQI